MGVMIDIGIVVASIIGTAVSQLLADEFKAWAPSIAEYLVRIAVSRVSPHCRERLDEEWHAHISEMPGSVAKIVTGLGFIFASRNIGEAQSALERPAVSKAGAVQIARTPGAEAQGKFDRVMLWTYRATMILVGAMFLLYSVSWLSGHP